MDCRMTGDPWQRGFMYGAAALAVAISLVLPTGAFGAVRNVPGTYATIQAAIDAADPGDTVMVEAATYPEFVNVNKANLVVMSSAGAATTIIQMNVDNNTPIVDITAPGVTLQGFTINQLDAGALTSPPPGNCAVRIRGEVASSATTASTLTIQDCTLTGNQSDQGILVNQNLTNAHLIVQNCTFAKNGGTYSFNRALDFYHTNPGGGLDTPVSANDCTIDLLNLTINDFEQAAVDFEETVHKTTININGGTWTGTATGHYGIRFGEDLHNFSALNITGTTIASVDEGLDVSDELGSRSTATITGLTVNNFRDTGLNIDYIYNNGSLQILNCTLAGDGVNANYGIYTDTEYSSTTLIDGNTISGVRQYGIYESYPYSGSTFTATNNTITLFDDAASSGYGIYVDTDYGSQTVVRGNTITGFNYAGIYEDYPEDGSSSVIESNVLTGAASGADYGIYFYGPYYGSQGSVINNTASNFDYAGIYIDYSAYGSSLSVRGNTLTALPAGSSYGIYLDYVEYGSTADVTGNSITGFTDTGLYVYEVYSGSTVTASNNVVTAQEDGGDYGIYCDEVYDGSSASFTANQISGFGNDTSTYGFYNDEVYDGASLTLANNTFTAHTGMAEYGFYSNDGVADGATAVMTGNTFTGFTEYGCYFDDPAYDGSELTLTGNTFTAAEPGAEYGIYFYSTIDYGSTVVAANNTVTGFTDYGFYVEGLDDGSSLFVQNNNLTAKTGGTASQYGIYYNDYTDYGSANQVLGNTVSGITDPDAEGPNEAAGIYVEGSTDGSYELVADNIVTGVPGGNYHYGIYCLYAADYGATFELLRNQVSGFAHSGIYLDDDSADGADVRLAGNQLTGGLFGIYYDSGYSIEGGARFEVLRNRITEFTDTGLWIGGEVWGCQVNIALNKILGSAAKVGIDFDDSTDGINSGAEVSVQHNCIGGVATGLEVEKILDTSWVVADFNDFSGVTTTGINNVAGDADHTIKAESNYFGALATKFAGNVDIDPELIAPPDDDADGVIDCADLCPTTPAGAVIDANGCSCLQLHPTADADSDGTLDCDDACPADPNKALPGQCGCGVPDTDTDGDGTADCADACPSDPNKTAAGICGCGTTDVDADGDGTANCVDGCPADPNKTAAGQCGCGVPDTDTDGDGTPDCVDACASDPNKTAAGVCGCGVAETDSDGDGVLDCNDQCPDEAGDACNNGCPTQPLLCGAGVCGSGATLTLVAGMFGLTGLKLRQRRRR